jgi:hypothetical protein
VSQRIRLSDEIIVLGICNRKFKQESKCLSIRCFIYQHNILLGNSLKNSSERELALPEITTMKL